MPNEMLRVELADGGVRRVNPRDKDAFLATNPGAKVLDEQPAEDEGAEAKAVEKPAENKARTMNAGDKKAEDK